MVFRQQIKYLVRYPVFFLYHPNLLSIKHSTSISIPKFPFLEVPAWSWN